MMHLRGVVLFLLCLAFGARRSSRINNFYQDAQRQKSMLGNGLEVSAEAREAFTPRVFSTGFSRRAGPKMGDSNMKSKDRVAPISANDFSMMKAMSDSFWTQRRARLQLERDQRLLELDELEAREKALQQVAASSGPPALSAGAGVAELKEMLEAERARSAQLEDMLAKKAAPSAGAGVAELQEMLKAERARSAQLEEMLAKHINKAAETKEALPAAAAAPAISSAPATTAKPAAADLVTDVPEEYLEPELSLKELREKLTAKGLPTGGSEPELRERLEQSMLLDRQKYKFWDPETLSWK